MKKKLPKASKILMLALLLILASSNGFSQEIGRKVTGKVVDSSGEPLIGVLVQEKATTNGVVTNTEGNYEISLSRENSILNFSYISKKTIEISVEGKNVVNVTMTEDLQNLDEIVVVGYGEQKKISVVGAQSQVRVKELEHPVANIGTMLAGRLAGLTGVQRQGLPGYDNADIWIRGLKTFGNSGPLVLIDGVERPLDNVNPRDVESFSILKDASATAVYGIRGANGVIMITTKQGSIGKPKVTFDYNEGMTQFTKMPDMLDGITYMELANEALTTRGEAPKYSQDYIEKTRNNADPFLYPNVDWFDAVFRDIGSNRSAHANINGGAQDAKYYASLGYYDETGLFQTDALESYNSSTRFKRYNFLTNLTLDITKTTEAIIGVNGYMSEGNYPAIGANYHGDFNSVFFSAMETTPVEYPILYPGGFVPGRSANGGLRNPYADIAKRGYQTQTKNQLYSNLKINQDLGVITEGLKLSALFAFDAFNQQYITREKRENTYIPDATFPYNEDGSLLLNETYTGRNYLGFNRSNWGNRRFYLESSLNYSNTFQDKHEVGGLLLFNRSDYVNAFSNNFTESIPFRNQGIATRMTYGYDERYFVELNAGYNGSENFAPNNRYGFFPSVAVGWVASNEKFFEPLSDKINYLKLRYSDGLVGADSGAGRFSYLSRVESGQGGFDFGETARWTSGIRETYYGVDVTWAESRKQDLGIEIYTLNNSLEIVVDAFKEHTEGAFLRRGDVPNYIGLANDPYGNLGVVENKGFDGSVDYQKNFGQQFVQFRGTFSYNKNKVLENGQPDPLYAYQSRIGLPLLARFGYVAERLFSLEDDIDGDGYITEADGFPKQFGEIMPGDIKYQDVNGDGIINAYDRVQIGTGDVPSLTYGFGVSTERKGFDLSMFFQGQNDADRVLGGQGFHPFLGDGGRGNSQSNIIDRWTPENNNIHATFPRLSFGTSATGQNNNTQYSNWHLVDQNFIRLKTAELGYNLPQKLTQKYKIDNTRLYMRGTNLLTFSDFKLWDPELNVDNGGRYPLVRTYSLGLEILF